MKTGLTLLCHFRGYNFNRLFPCDGIRQNVQREKHCDTDKYDAHWLHLPSPVVWRKPLRIWSTRGKHSATATAETSRIEARIPPDLGTFQKSARIPATFSSGRKIFRRGTNHQCVYGPRNCPPQKKQPAHPVGRMRRSSSLDPQLLSPMILVRRNGRNRRRGHSGYLRN